jgi:hypothetical protein
MNRLSRAERATIIRALVEGNCWRHPCMGMNPPVMAALNGDVDSGWRRG